MLLPSMNLLNLFRTQTYVTKPLSEFVLLTETVNVLGPMLVNLPKGVYLAGGAARELITGGRITGDIDFFFTNPKALKQMQLMLFNGQGPFDGYTRIPTGSSDYAKDLDYPTAVETYVRSNGNPQIQLISIKNPQNPEDIIDDFDFTVAQFATDGKTVWMGTTAWEDAQARRLVIHKREELTQQLKRIQKYANKGFGVTPKELSYLVGQLLNPKPKRTF